MAGRRSRSALVQGHRRQGTVSCRVRVRVVSQGRHRGLAHLRADHDLYYYGTDTPFERHPFVTRRVGWAAPGGLLLSSWVSYGAPTRRQGHAPRVLLRRAPRPIRHCLRSCGSRRTTYDTTEAVNHNAGSSTQAVEAPRAACSDHGQRPGRYAGHPSAAGGHRHRQHGGRQCHHRIGSPSAQTVAAHAMARTRS